MKKIFLTFLIVSLLITQSFASVFIRFNENSIYYCERAVYNNSSEYQSAFNNYSQHLELNDFVLPDLSITGTTIDGFPYRLFYSIGSTYYVLLSKYPAKTRVSSTASSDYALFGASAILASRSSFAYYLYTLDSANNTWSGVNRSVSSGTSIATGTIQLISSNYEVRSYNSDSVVVPYPVEVVTQSSSGGESQSTVQDSSSFLTLVCDNLSYIIAQLYFLLGFIIVLLFILFRKK